VTTIVVEASEAWPIVAAGLGSAMIVSWITLIVARKQRKADADRLDKQLEHDREMREQQRADDADRLDKQLVHDRDMRDLRHLRETLAPIVARLVDWDAFLTLHKALATASDAGHGQRGAIAQLASNVGNASEQLRRDSRILVVLAGPTAPIALWLKEVADDGDTLIHLARKWAETGAMTPEIMQALPALLAKYGNDHARFIEAANEAVRWGEPQLADSSAAGHVGQQ
jgi:hypothetical protein